ncbi:MAG: FKBP-type peptidyl-prolyl cis-trans isomerase [Bacteroidota bacterium]|nr:FKBP-type peptidyl-prolyl cis-trans isomerase [Bacteroidota bacterium]
MRKFIVVLLGATFAFAGCLKKNTGCSYVTSTTNAPDSEVTKLKDSLYNMGINSVTQDPSGFFYSITNMGTGNPTSNLCSTITISYKGSFLNGVAFDSTATGQTAMVQLGQLIVGWQKAIPLIGTGGDITIYLPPSLAYGYSNVNDNQGNLVIPAGSYLKFDIKLTKIQ